VTFSHHNPERFKMFTPLLPTGAFIIYFINITCTNVIVKVDHCAKTRQCAKHLRENTFHRLSTRTGTKTLVFICFLVIAKYIGYGFG
jgi:hypothetical protein